MKLKKGFKSAIAYMCAVTLVVTSMTGYQAQSVDAAIDVSTLDTLDYANIYVQGDYAEQNVANGETAVMQYAFVASESSGDDWISWMANGGYGDNTLVLWGNTNLAVKYSAVYPESQITVNGAEISNEGTAETQIDTTKYFQKDTYNELKITNPNGDVVTFVIKVGNPTEKEIAEPVTELVTEAPTADAEGWYQVIPDTDPWPSAGAWSYWFGKGWVNATGAYKGGEAVPFTLRVDTNNATELYGVQARSGKFAVENGKSYKYSIKFTSTGAATIQTSIDGVTALEEYAVQAGENEITGTFTSTVDEVKIYFALGLVPAETTLDFIEITFTETDKSPEQVEKERVEAKILSDANIAKNKTAFASSQKPVEQGYQPAETFDGNTGSRWAAVTYDPGEYIGVDLGEIKTVASVGLMWEGAYATSYDIQVSSDGLEYNTVKSMTATKAETLEIVFDEPVQAQYVRVLCNANAIPYGYSIYEMAVFETAGGTIEEPTTEAPTTEAPTTEAPETEAPTARPNDPSDVVLNHEAEPFIKTWDPGEGTGYAYMGRVYFGEITSDYTQLQITYTGAATAFDALRLEFTNTENAKVGTYWFTENAEGTIKTVDGTLVPAPSDVEQTVIIDLEKSGLDLSKGLMAFYVHNTAGMGAFTITDARFIKAGAEETPTTEEPTTEDSVDEQPVVPFGVVVNNVAEGQFVIEMGNPGNGQTYRLYIDGEFKQDLTLGAHVITDVPAGTHTVALTGVLNGVESEKFETEVVIPGEVASTEAPTTEAPTTEAPTVRPNDPSDVVLNHEAEPFIKTWDPGEGTAYAYMGRTYFGNLTPNYTQLQITYTGAATAFDALRLEFVNTEEGKVGTYWFTENAEGTLKTVDGTLVSAPSDVEQTVIIDLEKSGLDLSKGLMAFYIHNTQGMGAFTITDARFIATYEIETEAPTTEAPTTEAPTTVAPTTEAPTTVEPATEAPTKKITVKKSRVKKAVRTKNNKKIKITLKKVNGATGYKIKYSTKKSFKKKYTKTVTTKKVKKTIKKLKANKKYYIKVRAYKVVNGKKYYSKWTKAKKVKVRK